MNQQQNSRPQYRSRNQMKRAFRSGKGVYEDGQSSFSVNAQECRKRGRLPLSQAEVVVARLGRCTKKEARAALLATHDGEWHHASKYGNRVNYYDVRAAVNAVAQFPLFTPCCSAHAKIKTMLSAGGE